MTQKTKQEQATYLNSLKYACNYYMEKLGMTSREFAPAVNLEEETLNQWLRGSTASSDTAEQRVRDTIDALDSGERDDVAEAKWYQRKEPDTLRAAFQRGDMKYVPNQ